MLGDEQHEGVIDWRHGPALPEHRPRVLEALLAQAAITAGQEPVFSSGPAATKMTWSDLDQASGRLAQSWSALVQPGERVAIVADNGLAHLVSELAVWRLGGIAVPIAQTWGAPRIAALLTQVDPVILVSDVVDAPQGCVHWRTDAVLAASQHGPLAPWCVSTPDTPALMLFTSGSTGSARGVMLSHDNICSQQAAFAELWPDFGPGDRVAGYLPWHHSFGSLAERLWVLARGAHLTVIPGQGRDRDIFLSTLAAVRPTVFCSVPKLHGVAAAAGLPGPELRWAFTAGAPLPAGIAQAYLDRGIPVCEGWGLTETGPSATITPLNRPWISGLVGDPIPGVSVGVRSDGRLLVRGPGVMLGYWRDDLRAPSSVHLTAGGQRMVDSGDLGQWTPYGLRLQGRADHQLKLANGEKVPAAALEIALADVPGVLHAVVAADDNLTAIVELAATVDSQTVVAAIDALNGTEQIPWLRFKRVVRLTRSLSVDRGEITASHKVARHVVLARFHAWRSTGGDDFERLR